MTKQTAKRCPTQFDRAESIRNRTDADLYALEQTGFFSRKLSEQSAEIIVLRQAA